MNLILGWQRGPWNVTGTVRYVSGYDELPWSNEGASMPADCLWRLDRPGARTSRRCSVARSRRSTCRRRTRASRTGRSSGRSSTCSTECAVRARGRLRPRQLQLQLRVLRRHGHAVQPGRPLHVPVSSSHRARSIRRGNPPDFFVVLIGIAPGPEPDPSP